MVDYIQSFIVVFVFIIVVNAVLFSMWAFIHDGFGQKGNIFINYKNFAIHSKKFIIVNTLFLIVLVLMLISVYILHSGLNELQQGLNALEQIN